MVRLFNSQTLSLTRFLVFLLLLANIGCQKDLSKDTLGAGGTVGGGSTISDDYYYKLTFNGTNYSQGVTTTNNYINDVGVIGTPDAVFASGISYNSSSLPANGTEIGIVKGTLHNYTATKAELKAFFAPGNYSYGTLDLASNTMINDGISISWVEPGGNDLWLTLDGSLQQGSTFKIVSATEVTDASGYYLKVKVQFNCKLYSVNSLTSGLGLPISRAVTNGEAVLKYTLQ